MRRRSIFFLWVLTILAAGCRPSTDESPAAEAPARAEASGPSQGPGTATSADGVEIAYTVYGQGEPALVFVHGWSCDQSFWSEQVDVFAADHTVVTVDLGGHGASGSERTAWSLASLGDDVRAVVDAVGLERPVLVGHSMGGPAALEAARRMPGRVAGVVGVDTFHDAERKADPEQWEGFMADYEADFVGTCERFVRSMFLEGAAAERVESVVTEMCDAPPEVAIALLREFGTYDVAAVMRSVEAPIRSINAPTFPTAVETNRKYAPGFEAAVMEGVGHFLMMERPREFNELLAAAVANLGSSEKARSPSP